MSEGLGWTAWALTTGEAGMRTQARGLACAVADQVIEKVVLAGACAGSAVRGRGVRPDRRHEHDRVKGANVMRVATALLGGLERRGLVRPFDGRWTEAGPRPVVDATGEAALAVRRLLVERGLAQPRRDVARSSARES